ncbi:hypothetical protein IT575_02785 [bacterium]|nr:hypothetical protein [bacterium]
MDKIADEVKPDDLSAPDVLPAQEAAAAPAARVRPRGPQPWHAALLLFFLAPAMVRLLTTALSPAEYFSPIVWLGLHASLGAGAVLLREIAVRRRLDSWGRLLLGIALGLLYEGLVTRNLFIGEGGELGTLSGYGRALGINWIWGFVTIALYATQGFLLPLLVTEIALPGQRTAPALSRKGMLRLGLLTSAAALLGFFGISANIGDPQQNYHPGLFELLFCLAGVLGLPWLAVWRARRSELKAAFAATASAGPAEEDAAAETSGPAAVGDTGLAGQFRLQARGNTLRFVRSVDEPVRPSPRALGWLAGLATALLLFILPALCKDVLKIPDYTTLLLVLLGLGAALHLARRLSGRLSQAHHFALLAGTQGCWIALCLLLPLDDGLRPDETAGMPLLGLAALGMLIYTGRRLRRPAAASVQLAAAAGPAQTCG